jgi:hypothetical protein
MLPMLIWRGGLRRARRAARRAPPRPVAVPAPAGQVAPAGGLSPAQAALSVNLMARAADARGHPGGAGADASAGLELRRSA